MTILRDTLYSDKILAVLREYSANAWDSHRTSGKADVPIRVHLPTVDDPTLSIQDYGRGLSKEEVFTVYTQYGASTKRDSDLAVGMLGIGSKSGFAYSDTFTITSCYGGVKSLYSAMLDPSDKGVINLIAEEPCDITGITIDIPVQVKDFSAFIERAKNLFVHFDPRPIVNVHLEDKPTYLGKYEAGTLYKVKEGYSDQQDGFIAVMGCIPYRVDLYQLKDFDEGLNSVFFELSGQVNFKIGEVHVNASREELKYSDQTKRALLDKLNKVVEEYIVAGTRHLKDPQTSEWQKRLSAQVLNRFKFFIPKDMHYLLEYSPYIDRKLHEKFIDDAEKKPVFSFFPGSSKKETLSFPVVAGLRVLIRDDTKLIKGYGLGNYDLVVRPRDKTIDLKDVRRRLDELFVEMKLTGIPILNLSSLPYTKPTPAAGSAVNIKHSKKFFVYNGKASRTRYINGRRKLIRSESWDSVQRVPQATDVYVEIMNFQVNWGSFDNEYASDRDRCKRYGIPFPTVYGYKIRSEYSAGGGSKPRVGTEYREWRKTMALAMMETKLFQDHLVYTSWTQAFERLDQIDLKRYEDVLGPNHDLVRLFADRADVVRSKHSKDFVSDDVTEVKSILGKLDPKWYPGQVRRNELLLRYPLLSVAGFAACLIGAEVAPSWIEYIKLIDANVVRTAPGAALETEDDE